MVQTHFPIFFKRRGGHVAFVSANPGEERSWAVGWWSFLNAVGYAD